MIYSCSRSFYNKNYTRRCKMRIIVAIASVCLVSIGVESFPAIRDIWGGILVSLIINVALIIIRNFVPKSYAGIPRLVYILIYIVKVSMLCFAVIALYKVSILFGTAALISMFWIFYMEEGSA